MQVLTYLFFKLTFLRFKAVIEIIYKWNFKAIILIKSNLDFNSLTIVYSSSFLFFLRITWG